MFEYLFFILIGILDIGFSYNMFYMKRKIESNTSRGIIPLEIVTFLAWAYKIIFSVPCCDFGMML